MLKVEHATFSGRLRVRLAGLRGDAAELASDPPRGLSSAAAHERLLADGPNLLPQAKRRSHLAALSEQFRSLPVLMLAGSAAVSVATGGVTDAVATLVVIVTNGALGYVTEGQAESVIEALTSEDVCRVQVRVLRDGQQREVPASELVRDDVYLVRARLQRRPLERFARPRQGRSQSRNKNRCTHRHCGPDNVLLVHA